MLRSICKRVLLASACTLAAVTAWGQGKTTTNLSPVSTDIGVTFAAERAYIAPGTCNCFWLKGGGADVSVTFWKGLGIAAALTGDHASTVRPGVDVNKVAFLAGPRFTYTMKRASTKRSFQFFGEGLVGVAHTFDTAVPSASGLKSSASSIGVQSGGGFSVPLARGFGVRLLELDYVRTAFPNGSSDVQNDFRIGGGLTYHLGSRRR